MICGLLFVTLQTMYVRKNMKRPILLLLAALLASSCANPAARTHRSASANQAPTPAAKASDTANAATSATTQPVYYTYRVKAVHPHPTDAYTQGLLWHDGALWEGTGQHGASVVQRYDTVSWQPRVVTRLPRAEFGEGIALVGDELFQLTWLSNTAHVYRLDGQGRLTKIRDHRYAGEGWGLATDGSKLYFSDGSADLLVLDPATFRRERRITVTCEGVPVNYLNELEWIDGRLWANVYTTDQIVIIDPASGRVEGIVDLAGLLPDEERTPATDVLNGIAWDPDGRRLFVTGKNWSKLFEIELIEQ